jgi:hypothetical protein
MQEGRSWRPEKVPTTAVALGLDQGLIAAVAAQYEQAHGAPATTRETINYGIVQHLDDLVAGLHRLGFRGGKIGKRRPRRINQADWDRLQAASAATGLPASTLLRACLQWIKENPTN